MDRLALAYASLLQVGLNQQYLREVLRRGIDPWSLLHAPDTAELASLGMRASTATKLASALEAFDTDAFARSLDALSVRPILHGSADYPALLAELPSAPGVLYLRGELPAGPALAIVGSRTPTDYSGRVLRQWIPTFVEAGFVIVSGGAYGVDSLAHSLTLASGGRTVAVLGTGIDIAHPVSNAPLYDRIVAENGAVISEFALGTPGGNYTFPIRNATIAGLAHATLVTEAAEKSGSLITARLANDFGRDVFALPGDIFRTSSAGTNTLIRAGEATAAISAPSMVEALGLSSAVRAARVAASVPEFSDPLDGRIVAVLREGGRSMDALRESLDVAMPELSVRLIELEFRDILIRQPHGTYELR